MYNCLRRIENNFDNAHILNIPQRLSWSLSMVGSPSGIDITTQLAIPHPVGTLSISRNGIVVKTHTLTTNQSIVFDDYFTTTATHDDYTISF